MEETPEQVEHVRMEYAASLSMCDAWLGKVLDLMDDLLAYLVPSAVLLLLFLLITILVGVWVKARSQIVRYGAIVVALIALLLSAAGAGMWMFQASETPRIPPMTPTPTPAEEALWSAPSNGRAP